MPVIALQAGAPAVSGSDIVAFAEKYLGSPYVRSGRSPRTCFSDLGFVRFVYRSKGVVLPGNRRAMFRCAAHVRRGTFQPGDIVYFRNTIRAGLSHVGIYMGAGRFIHAEWYDRGVTVTSVVNDPVDGNYWAGKLIRGNRSWAQTQGSL